MLPTGPLDLPAVLEKPDEPEQQSLTVSQDKNLMLKCFISSKQSYFV